MAKLNPRLESFIHSLEESKAGYVQEWFASARLASQEKYKAPVLQQAFLAGAIPEVFDLRDYDMHEMRSKNVYEQQVRGRAWRQKHPPEIVGCWFKSFRFEKKDGSYTTFRLPLDPAVIDRLINRVKRSVAFE